MTIRLLKMLPHSLYTSTRLNEVGALVKQFTLTEGLQSLLIDHLTKGLYYYCVKNDKTITKKPVVQE